MATNAVFWLREMFCFSFIFLFLFFFFFFFSPSRPLVIVGPTHQDGWLRRRGENQLYFSASCTRIQCRRTVHICHAAGPNRRGGYIRALHRHAFSASHRALLSFSSFRLIHR